MTTALNGTLIRDEHGDYYWSDGTHEPRVRSMRLKDLAPNFRCSTIEGITYVEVPMRWHAPKNWPGEHVDDDAAAAIRELIAGRETSDVYAEGLAESYDAPQLRRKGYLVPVAEWDAALNEQCGIWWDKADEPAILHKASSLR